MGIWDKNIDKTIPTPLYFQVEQIIRKGILSGELSMGEMIPTEKELVELYGVSRSTIRQAIFNLVNDQLLRREKSKGTFVIKPTERIHLFESLSWFSKYLEKTGIPFSTKILSQGVINANQDIAKYLSLNTDELVFFVKRIRYLNDTPYLLDEHFVPINLCRGIENIYNHEKSLYTTLLSDFGLILHHGWREFEPTTPSKEVADILEIYSTTPILKVHSTVYDKDGIPVDYFIANIHGKFSVDISLNIEGKI